MSATMPHAAPAAPRPLNNRPLSRWPVPRATEVLCIPLGGLGQIGMNWTLYGHDGRWLLVDAGIGFPERNGAGSRADGVEAIIPDPACLSGILPKLDGLVVTHAHEDHIGAIHRLWPEVIDCPIHASPFAAALISRRLDEAGTLRDVDLRSFEVGSTFAVGPFSVRTIRMTHSVPEPVALAIGTPAGCVLHTGDWKFDPAPLLDEPADKAGLAELGQRGVLAMVCDSTNADRDLPISSEAQVRAAFDGIFARSTGMVVVCCFASNVARMTSAALAATQAGREVAIGGRSMVANEAVADDLGMLEGVPAFLEHHNRLRDLERQRAALICTGTQGEEFAMLARLSRGERNLPALGRGDTVVMSARVIPGNGDAVEAVLGKLRARGVEVITADHKVGGYPVHVSGHAGRQELRELHETVRPRFVLPVHGEASHLAAHAALALECGAEAAPVAADGQVLCISQGGIRSLGRLTIPRLQLMEDTAPRQRQRPRAAASVPVASGNAMLAL